MRVVPKAYETDKRNSNKYNSNDNDTSMIIWVVFCEYIITTKNFVSNRVNCLLWLRADFVVGD